MHFNDSLYVVYTTVCGQRQSVSLFNSYATLQVSQRSVFQIERHLVQYCRSMRMETPYYTVSYLSESVETLSGDSPFETAAP